MSFTVLDMPQRSPEWVTARLGRLTASVAADMLATIRSGEAAARRNLRVRLVLERLTGRSMENPYQSQAMLDGVAREADALRRYEAHTGRLVRRSGFLQHTELLAGASLDGHLGDFERVVEVKCPTPAIHLEYLRSGIVPDEYAKQITHQLWITGALSADFLSYNPDFPERLQVLLVTVPRNFKAVAEYGVAAEAFLKEVETEYQALLTMANPMRVLAGQVA